MIYRTLVSSETLHQQLNNSGWVIIDCRFSLADAALGSYVYRHGHLPNARYADLNKDLSSPVRDYTGRHPLPDFRELVKKLGQWGVSNHSQVVVYDAACGAIAGRLWWLLRCLGHDKVALLDGGIKDWQSKGFPLTTMLPQIKPVVFRPYLNADCWLNAEQVQSGLAQRTIRLIDARSPERYRGEQEPIDPVAGHIPHAVNRNMQLNLDGNGLFLPAEQLRLQFKTLLGHYAPGQVVHSCGSGVTACHNLLAMEHAGLTDSKLYAGSWSEWNTNKNRPVAAG